jgi:HNH endonuclease
MVSTISSGQTYENNQTSTYQMQNHGCVRELASGLATRRRRQRRSSQDLDQQLRQAIKEMHRAESMAVLLFSEIMRGKHFRDFGCSTIQHYSRDHLGFSDSKTYQFIRMAQDLERLPQLRSALQSKKLGWTIARELTKVASAENEKQWIEKARKHNRRELIRMVKHAQAAAKRERQSNPQQSNLRSVTPRGCQSSLQSEERSTQPGKDPSTQAECSPATQPGFEIGIASSSSTPIADGPTSVTFRFTPVELARYDVLCEKLRKSRRLPATISKESMLLLGMQCLLERGFVDSANSSETHGPGPNGGKNSAGNNRKPTATNPQHLTRVQYATPYHIDVSYCESCGKGAIETNRGQKILTTTQLEAMKCDAVVKIQGRPNRQTIRPSVRSAILRRDRHTCQAPGCHNRRFLEIHHLRPRSKGGKNNPDNLVTLCSACHRLSHEWQIPVPCFTKPSEPAEYISPDPVD